MESQLSSVGYLYQTPAAPSAKPDHPLAIPYAQMPKYSLEQALFQGTLFPIFDDHWRQKEQAFKEQFKYR